MAEEPRRLGRGLAALIGSPLDEAEVGVRGQRRAPIEFLRPNSKNPRKDFITEELDDLANSIREKGILQPILVRVSSDAADIFEIIAGERRWRAAQKAGLHDVPIVVVVANDQEALELAIIENVQRTDLNPLEEAAGYERLVSEYGYSQNDLAKTIGKSRSHVANMMRLLKLPDSTKQLLSEGKITAGHARALLAVASPETVAGDIVSKGLTVRDIELIGQEEAGQIASAKTQNKTKQSGDANTRALEKKLSDLLGLAVVLKARGESGDLILRYRTLEQLDALCAKLEA